MMIMMMMITIIINDVTNKKTFYSTPVDCRMSLPFLHLCIIIVINIIVLKLPSPLSSSSSSAASKILILVNNVVTPRPMILPWPCAVFLHESLSSGEIESSRRGRPAARVLDAFDRIHHGRLVKVLI